MKAIFTTHIKTRYHETDQGGRIYHSNYLVWLDIARTEYLAFCGLEYATLEQEGLFIVVKKVECDYLKPALFNQKIGISIIAIEKFQASFAFTYEIFYDKIILSRACTRLVCINDKGKLIKIPEKIAKKIGRSGGIGRHVGLKNQ